MFLVLSDAGICQVSLGQQYGEQTIVCLPTRRAEVSDGAIIGSAVRTTWPVGPLLGEGQVSSAAAFERPSLHINHLLMHVCKKP